MTVEVGFIPIDEQDFEEALGEEYKRMVIEQKGAEHLASEGKIHKFVEENLAKVLAFKLSKNLPKGFDLSEVSLKFEIKGQPMGVGIGGSVTAKYTKN